MSAPKGGQPYTAELRRVERELKIHNAKVRAYRDRKRKLMNELYRYMTRNNLTQVEGYTIDKVRPRERAPPKPKKPEREQRHDVVELYRQVGILNPDQLYNETRSLQR